ncbi:putative bifunctional diguanylate cyclase/phosphodiesterase [Rhodanobacter ginsengiterrae]|uniref:putative bifunctional diguanylate cyclase/phosphodiesterase n=1 Tax=Rhodanobacter ginsengiterrae TaxID=2008451 RepID=UPI003CEB02E5
MNCTLANESPQAHWLAQLDTATRPAEIAAMIVELAEAYAECASARVLWELGAGIKPGRNSPEGWLRGVAASGIPQRVPAIGAVAFRLCERPRPILLLLTLHNGCDATALIAELQPLLQLAGRRLGILLGWIEQHRAPPPLEYSERLHRALFSIADLAGCGRDIRAILREIHAVMRGLLPADNFCVVSHDPQRELLRFVYASDPRSLPPLAASGNDVSLASISGSPLWYLLGEGKALLGTPAQLGKQVSGPLVVELDDTQWMGVPMLYQGEIHGAVVVRSRQPDHGYSNEDLVLLEFVATHIRCVIERHRDADVEREEQLRAMALVEANRVLQDRVAQRSRALHKEVGERARVQQQLAHEQTHDALTGLANPRCLHEHIERLLGMQQGGPSGPVALLQLNLDRFAGINDGLGHFTGDQVLQQVAARLSECLGNRPGLVARLAGDEFAVLIEQVAGARQAMRMARRIIDRIGQPICLSGREFHVSARIGLLVCDARYCTLEQVLRNADIALHRAASVDFPRIALFEPAMADEVVERLALETDLREALREHAFKPYFQPIRRLHDNTIAGYEALIRWPRPGHGVLEPADFLKQARNCRLIEAIDWQLFEHSFRSFAQHGPADTFLTFNVSAAHLGTPDFDRRLLELLASVKLPASRVVAEVTEEALLENPDQVHTMLVRLRAAGVSAALDDFGTGYSSLHYLQCLPLRMLKVDRVFVDGLGKPATSGSANIIAAVIALARSMDIQVIAEGIETVEQRHALAAMGCPLGQGYLLGRPDCALSGTVVPAGAMIAT